MILKGIEIDFKDKKVCGKLPSRCYVWDERSDELDENEELIAYWDEKIKEVLSKTDKIIAGTIESKSICLSDDKKSIDIISDVFDEFDIKEVEYNDIVKYNTSLKYNYLVR